MTETSPDHEIKCPDCGVVVTKETNAEAVSLVESHNEARHNGDDIAHVVGKHDPLLPFTDIIDDTEQKRQMRRARHTEGEYRVCCPDCEQAIVEDSISDGKESIKKHDTNHHNSEHTAGFAIEDVDGTAANRDKPYMVLNDTLNCMDILAEISQQENIVTLANISSYIQSP
jgi:hypothetical protein